MENQTNSHMTIKRLLGPAEPEILCDECFEKMDRFAEIEFSGSDAAPAMPLVQDHLRKCEDCHEKYEALLMAVGAG